jgi:hypothetical protein
MSINRLAVGALGRVSAEVIRPKWPVSLEVLWYPLLTMDKEAYLIFRHCPLWLTQGGQ